jgi:hypothetical protein
MALQPQTQEIPLAVGIDTADDPQGTPQGFPVLENLVWSKDRVPQKRYGFRRLSGSSNPYADTMGLVGARSSLGIVRQNKVNQYVGGSTAVVIANTFVNPSTLVDQETYGTYYGGTAVSNVDFATLTAFTKNWMCIVTTRSNEASGGAVTEVHVQGIDLDRGGVVFDQTLGTDTFGARVLVMTDGSGNDFFAITYCLKTGALTSTLKWVALAPVFQLTLGSPVTVASTGAALLELLDVVIVAGSGKTQMTVAYVDTGGNYRLRTLSNAGASVATVLSTLAQTGSQCCCLTQLASGTYALWTGDRVVLFTSALVQSSSTAYSTANQGPGAVVEISANVLLLLQESSTRELLVSTFDAVGLAGVLIETRANLFLASKVWSHVEGSSTAWYALATPANSIATGYHTNLIVRLATNSTEKTATVGQVGFDETSLPVGTTLQNILPQVVAIDADNFYVASLADLETPDSTTTVATRRVRISKLHMGAVGRPITAVTLENTAYIAGSMPLAFDGTGVRLASFVDAPSAPTLGSSSAGVLTGQYTWRVLYEYTDVHGNIQVSPPSPTSTTPLTAQQLSLSGTMTANILPDGQSGQRNFRVKLYRTTAGGSSFFLAYTLAVTPGATWTIADNAADTALKESLYTTGNVLESEPAPPLAHLAAHRNRLFGPRADTPEIIAYTQETFDPFLPRWHSSLTYRVDNSDGPPTAVASLSDKQIIFQANAICAVAGQGPDGTGGNGSFSLPENIARGVGVTSAEKQSVCVVPNGVMFRHSTGIQLLGPDLSVSPVGRPIEDYLTGYTTVRGRYLPVLHQTWFLLAPNTATTSTTPGAPQRIAVYDNRYGRWSILTTEHDQFVDVLELNGVVYLATAAQLVQYDPTSYLDDLVGGTDVGFPMAIETPWFRVDRAQALRLWKIHLSGTVDSFELSQINLYVYTQNSEQFNKSAGGADSSYVWDSTQLDATPPGPTTLTARVVTQRCTAFRCRLEITSDPANLTSVFRPATITYDYGVLPTRGKVPAGKRPTNVS